MNPLAELRSIFLREIELEKEKEELERRKLELLDLSSGSRKSGKDMLTREQGKALFAIVRSKNYELGKAQ